MRKINDIFHKIISFVLSFSFCLSSFANPIKAYAQTITKSIVNDNHIRVRTGAGTTFSIVQVDGKDLKLNAGHVVTVLSEIENPSDSNCESRIWKNIEFIYDSKSYNGYMCGDYITTTVYEPIDDSDFDAYLINEGFPESYWAQLKELHAMHPNWKFKAIKTGISWKTIVDNQSAATGKSLIQTSYDGWKNIDTYIYSTNKFRDDYRGGGPGWYAASREIVSYYLDPRNFLSEIDVFIFERTSYDPSNHTLEGVERILKGTWMENKIVEGTTKTYAQVFIDAAIDSQASPYFLASRVIQELGRSTPSSIISGTIAGYEGYYNYYNINATGSSVPSEIIARGLNYAKSKGWDSRYKAILGGAKWIADDYINIGQDTLYTQKWDIVGDLFSHQYMQNIQAPASEVTSVYRSYLEMGIIDIGFIFNIPVYDDMPSSPVPLPSKENPISYLSSISINNNSLTTFSYDKDTYHYTVSSDASTIDIKALPKINGAKVTGTGIINLEDDVTNIELVVTALNGNQKTYKIIVTKSAEVNANIDEVMVNSGMKYDDNFIWGLELGTHSSVLINNIKNVNANTNVSIMNSQGTPKKEEKMSTGDKIIISINNETKTYDSVVYGDVSGDGEITVLDLLKVQKHILGSAKLNSSSSYYKAADVSKDSNITVLDLLKIQKHILGSSPISQS